MFLGVLAFLIILIVSMVIFYCKKWLKQKEIELLEWDERDLSINRYYSSKSFFFKSEDNVSSILQVSQNQQDEWVVL